MTSNQKRSDVKIVTPESMERHESGVDENIRKSGIDGVKVGYKWEDK